MEHITKDILIGWGACEEGVELFCEHFEKATLEEISTKCIEIGKHENAMWLYKKCRELNLFEDTTSRGYANSGNHNSGDRNSGNWNSGNWNSGNWNSGYQNSGNWNSGDRNSGDRNSGNWNSGNWNSCNNESGYFNSQDDEYVRVFNSRVKRSDWDNCDKPYFIYEVKTNYWVHECDMTNAEKADDPDSYARGGQLRTRGYKEAWKLAYESATEDDIKLLKALPGFDADVFEEITGVRV